MLVSIYLQKTDYSLLNNLERNSLFHHKTGGRGHWNFVIDYNKIKDLSIHHNKLDYNSFKKWMQKFYGDVFYFSNENPRIIYVKNNKMGWVIGKGGWRIKKLQQEFGVIKLIETFLLDSGEILGEIIEIPEPLRNNLNITSISRYYYPDLIRELLLEMETYRIWDNNYYKEVEKNTITPFFKKNFSKILKKQIKFKVSELTPDLGNWGFRTGDLEYDLKYHSDHPFFNFENTKKLLLDLYQIKKLIREKDRELENSEKYKYIFLNLNANIPHQLVEFISEQLEKIPNSVTDIESTISGIDIQKTVEFIINCYNANTAKYEKKPRIIKK